MSERLIPFDFAEFVKDPSRLRYLGRAPARASVACGDCVAALWDNGDDGSIFTPDQFRHLRLAAKTRKVRVRVFRILGTGAISVATNATGANLDAPGVYPWISDPVEIEITE